MKKTNPILVLALLPLLSLSPAFSQPGGGRMGGPGGPGGGRMGGPGGFGGMRNSPKRQLTRWLGGVERLDADSKTKLNKAQAKKIVSLVGPWRTRKTMTDAQAKPLVASLSNILTAAQKKALEAERGRGMGGPGGGPGGFGGRGQGGPGGPGGPGGRGEGRGPDGGGPGGGRDGGRGPGGPGGMGGQRPTEAQMKAMRGYMENSNPLASPRLSPGFSSMPDRMQKRMIDRYRDSDTFFKKLSQRAR